MTPKAWGCRSWRIWHEYQHPGIYVRQPWPTATRTRTYPTRPVYRLTWLTKACPSPATLRDCIPTCDLSDQYEAWTVSLLLFGSFFPIFVELFYILYYVFFSIGVCYFKISVYGIILSFFCNSLQSHFLWYLYDRVSSRALFLFCCLVD